MRPVFALTAAAGITAWSVFQPGYAKADEPPSEVRSSTRHEAAMTKLKSLGMGVAEIWYRTSSGKDAMYTGCSVDSEWHGEDKDFDDLTNLTNLREVSAYTTATDRLLESLARCRSLVTVHVGGEALSNDGVRRLSKLPRLHTLEIHAPRVTDKAMCALAKITTLSHVDIGGCAVGDVGVKRLLRLPLIAFIGLEGTLVSDKCIPLLATSESLDTVAFARIVADEESGGLRESRESNVTPQAIAELRRRRPDITVHDDLGTNGVIFYEFQ